LQRIQSAFDQEHRPHEPPARRHAFGGGPATKPHGHRRSGKRKGMMQRAVDACLKSFGVADSPDQRPTERRPAAARDARRPAPGRSPRQERAADHGGPPRVVKEARPAAPHRPPRQERAADHGAPPRVAKDARPAPHRPPRGERADVRVMPARPAREVPAPPLLGPPRPAQGEPRSGMRPQRPSAPPRVPSREVSPPSIDSLKLLARHVEQQLERGRPLVPSEGDARGALTPEFKSTLNRALETCVDQAKLGYRFLVKGEEFAAEDAAGAELAPRVARSFERELRTGLRVLILGLGIAGGWATLVPLSGAVVVTGSLVVQSDIKKIQHPTGGVVAQIAVRDGMHVKAGDLVARLDETQVRANLQVITKQLDEIMVRIARLTAERDGADAPQMPPELAARPDDEEVKARFASETTLFNARATARQSQKDLLKSRIAQLGEQIDGLDAQIKSNASQSDLIVGELKGVQTLFDKQLAPITRLNSLQRDAARLDGERGQLQSSIAETKSKINEAQLQTIRVDQDFRADVIKDLREAEAKEAELAERRVAAQDQLDRIEIRAPTSGIIHQLAIHTVGGVVTAGQVVMEIVPDSDELQVEAKLQPNDIDQVKVGQTTFVRFSAFNQRTTPQLKGVVSYISADLSHEQQNDPKGFYTVRVTLPEEEHRRLNGLQLISGMPAEIFVQTGSRTMMSYLLKPIREQLGRAFNER
jgi:HlyD family secretion protein